MNVLQVYKGYTVDYRLKEFRGCAEGWKNHGLIEFIDFDSDKGDSLLCEMIDKNLVPKDILSSLF